MRFMPILPCAPNLGLDVLWIRVFDTGELDAVILGDFFQAGDLGANILERLIHQLVDDALHFARLLFGANDAQHDR
jgi:hypothetical protein